MKFNRRHAGIFIVIIFLVIIISIFFCRSALESENLNLLAQYNSQNPPTPTNGWLNLQVRNPSPHTTALPGEQTTPIDGTYAKFDTSWPQWWACRRCADYRPAGGIWKMRFDGGVFRIYYDVTGWNSVASYTINGDHLYIFNDPYCPEVTGEYRWELEDRWGLVNRFLILETIEDACSIRLRGENLSNQEWGACYPPNEMTGASGHYHKPTGCEDISPPLLDTAEADNLPKSLSIYHGEARQFAVPPDIIVNANSSGISSPTGITVNHNDESIPYGLSRVLWGESSWVEAVTSEAFESIGVQILGDYTIGWARVLFDRKEVWRGNTSEIWNDKGRFGGYIEVTGIIGEGHDIRVESLGFDFHPVTIAYFGFKKYGQVQMEEDK